MRAIRIASEKMAHVVSNDLVKMALAKNVPAAADTEIIEGAEVLMVREKPMGK